MKGLTVFGNIIAPLGLGLPPHSPTFAKQSRRGLNTLARQIPSLSSESNLSEARLYRASRPLKAEQRFFFDGCEGLWSLLALYLSRRWNTRLIAILTNREIPLGDCCLTSAATVETRPLRFCTHFE